MKEMYRKILRKHIAIIMIVVGIITALFIGLLMRVQTLSWEVGQLSIEKTALQTQLAAYERTLCHSEEGLPRVSAVPELTRYNLIIDGVERSYQVHVPKSYDPSVRYPVILSFDGVSGSGERMRRYSNLDTLPAIAVYPDSLIAKHGHTAWQSAPYSADGDRDIVFIRQLLEILPSQYCVDSTQIFAVGMSNGGGFAAQVGCEMGSAIRAVATVSGAFYETCQLEERTPSLLVIHSEKDGQVPFMGASSRHLPRVQKWVNEQAVRRDCQMSDPSYILRSTAYYTWRDCSDGSLLQLVVVKEQPHGWLLLPGAKRDGIETTADYIWKFFQDTVYVG